MKYRVLALFGVLALSAGSILQAQDYDDIYYDASKSTGTVKTKVMTPVKTVSTYGEVPDKYKVAAHSNYRVERDEDEYNRRGPAYEPVGFEVDINGDTIYFDNDSIYDDEAFANTRLIERFYNPDVVILSTDDELVELYYDESPTVNLIIGSNWGYSTYGWGFDAYSPWYTGFGHPWWYYSYTPYGHYYWGLDWGFGWAGVYWPHSIWYRWHSPYYWGYWGPRPWSNMGWGEWGGWHGSWWAGNNYGHRSVASRHWNNGGNSVRAGLATNRNGRDRVSSVSGNRNSISARGDGVNRGSGVGSRPGYAGNRNSGNMGSRRSAGVTTRSSAGTSGVSRSSAGNRSYSGSSSYGGNRSYSSGSSSYGGSRSSSGSSSYGGSRSSSGSSSYGGSRSSGGSYSGGSHGSSGGGSNGGSSGGGGRRR